MIAAIVAVLAMLGAVRGDTPPPPTWHRVAIPPTVTPCVKPAPTTAAGYQAMFAALPASSWGGADVSISVRVTDGRIVWLYGDTLTQASNPPQEDLSLPWRMVHSSAIVQRGGCLRVANGGDQLFPDDPAGWYWIHDAKALPGDELSVRARRIVKIADCAWCFADGGSWLVEVFKVSTSEELMGESQSDPIPGPPPAAGPFYPAVPDVPHHYGYSRVIQPVVLADGKHLVSTCQNDDDGLPHPWSWFRPYFGEQ